MRAERSKPENHFGHTVELVASLPKKRGAGGDSLDCVATLAMTLGEDVSYNIRVAPGIVRKAAVTAQLKITVSTNTVKAFAMAGKL